MEDGRRDACQILINTVGVRIVMLAVFVSVDVMLKYCYGEIEVEIEIKGDKYMHGLGL